MTASEELEHLAEEINKSIHSEDEEDELLEQRAPGTPFALIALSYMFLLVVLSMTVGMWVWIF